MKSQHKNSKSFDADNTANNILNVIPILKSVILNLLQLNMESKKSSPVLFPLLLLVLLLLLLLVPLFPSLPSPQKSSSPAASPKGFESNGLDSNGFTGALFGVGRVVGWCPGVMGLCGVCRPPFRVTPLSELLVERFRALSALRRSYLALSAL